MSAAGSDQPGDLLQLGEATACCRPMRPVKQLEDADSKLRKAVTDLSLRKEALQDACRAENFEAYSEAQARRRDAS